MKRTPLKRTGFMKRTRVGPRPGRLKGEDLTKLRDECYVRDEGRCVDCGVKLNPWLPPIAATSYHMAHIKAKRIGGDSLSNVKAMCGSCHRNSHNAGGKPCPRKDGTR